MLIYKVYKTFSFLLFMLKLHRFDVDDGINSIYKAEEQANKELSDTILTPTIIFGDISIWRDVNDNSFFNKFYDLFTKNASISQLRL